MPATHCPLHQSACTFLNTWCIVYTGHNRITIVKITYHKEYNNYTLLFLSPIADIHQEREKKKRKPLHSYYVCTISRYYEFFSILIGS